MSVKGIIMFLGMNNTRLEEKILIILDFENGFLPTYLPQCDLPAYLEVNKCFKQMFQDISIISKHLSNFFKALGNENMQL